MQGKVVIVDYEMGNINSVKKKITHLKVNSIVSSNPKDIETADKVILPGVGHFKKAIENLGKLDLLNALNEAVLVKEKPILGICLGMQIMANTSEEGDAEGLGWFDANVIRFEIKDTLKYKIPHIGWNQITKEKDSILMKDIPELSEFYFVHSYHFIPKNKNDILNKTEYEYEFVSAIESNNIFGVQYHPEKSHDDGDILLKNFINI